MNTFSKESVEFLRKAGRQKKADWLDRNRDEYERTLLKPLQNLATVLRTRLGSEAPGYHFPQKGIGRLRRGTPSENGALFKNWFSYTATRPSGSRFDHNPSLFFMINSEDEEGDEFLLAGGLYMPSSRQLRAIREAIATDARAFDQLFADRAFAARFKGGFSRERSATRPPRGFDPQHPRLDWLKLQGFYVWRSYRPKELSSPKFAELLAQDARQILRLNELLDQAIQGRWTQAVSPRGLRQDHDALSRIAEIDQKARPAMDF
jgi:uncharacterized protein (TIGR02453 family)